MKAQLKFKTTINCGGCIASVTPALNSAVGEGNWQVDINDPAKILTVDSDTVGKDAVIEAVNKAGFQADSMDVINE